MDPWPFDHQPGNKYRGHPWDNAPWEVRAAWNIATKFGLNYREAVAEIIRRGIAQDIAQADELIREADDIRR